MSSLRGEALLDAVDDRQLGRALVGLGEQPLGLVEQPRVLQGHGQTRRESRQQPDVRLAEGVGAVEILQRNAAEDRVAAR